MYKKYFNKEQQLREFWKEQKWPEDVLDNCLRNPRINYNKAIELGHEPVYVLEKNNFGKIIVDVSLPKNISLEDIIKIRHSHQNLGSKIIDYLIKQEKEKC